VGDSNIEWTDKTWNPTRGCERISPGCQHCYAEAMAHRFAGPGQPYDGLVKLVTRDVRQYKTVGGEPTGDFRTVTRTEPRWTGEVRFVPEMLERPLRWRKPQKIFVDSMSDLFHPSVTNEQIAAVFGVMAAAPRHTFQVLTKRAKRMREWFAWLSSSWKPAGVRCWEAARVVPGHHVGLVDRSPRAEWPLPNVWLGVSIENQAAADERIPDLLATPAALRFLSCEPLLGPLYLVPWLAGIPTRGRIHANGTTSTMPSPPIDWVIAGCESGPDARPAQVDWYRSLRDQCAAAGVPYFLKQAMHTPGDFIPFDANGRKCSATLAVGADVGSKRKADGVITLPYLDGAQYAAFPEPR
jgi:protein gp37